MNQGFLKCNCHHCDGHIEYPVESVGDVVRCPHCNLPTPLVVPGGEDPDLVSVGGGGAKMVVATLVILLAVVIAAFGTVMYVNHLKKGDDSPLPSEDPAPSGDAHGAVVPDGEWKNVNPQIGPYQAGLSAAQVTEGRYLLSGPCTECHKIYDPVTFARSEWDASLRTMRGKAKLNNREYEDLCLFVQSIRQ